LVFDHENRAHTAKRSRGDERRQALSPCRRLPPGSRGARAPCVSGVALVRLAMPVLEPAGSTATVPPRSSASTSPEEREDEDEEQEEEQHPEGEEEEPVVVTVADADCLAAIPCARSATPDHDRVVAIPPVPVGARADRDAGAEQRQCDEAPYDDSLDHVS